MTLPSPAAPLPMPANQPGFLTRIYLTVITGDHVPSFKNRKRAIVKNNGQTGLITEKSVKKRMALLESRIESALYSWSPTDAPGTDLEWRKQLRIALSGLSDDSLAEIPEFSFGVRHVEKGFEGVEIEIERL